MAKEIEIGLAVFRDQYSLLVDGGDFGIFGVRLLVGNNGSEQIDRT